MGGGGGAGARPCSAGLADELDGGAVFTVDGDVCESRDTNEIYPDRCQITSCDGNGLDSLVRSTGAYRLDLDSSALTDNARDSACNRVWYGS